MNLGGVVFDAEDIEQMECVVLNDAAYALGHCDEPNGFSWAEESMRILARLMRREVAPYDLLSMADMANTDGHVELSERLYEAFEALFPYPEGEEQ